MLLWFVILAPVLVAEVFRSPMIDYRMVALGAVVPLAEGLTGGPLIGHTLLGPVLALTVVMAVTQNRRLVRRRWLGVPIGMFMHLVLDGTWTSQALMWWPVFGTRFDADLPEFTRPAVVVVIMELIALGAGIWAWRHYALDEPKNRTRLFQTGQLQRGVL